MNRFSTLPNLKSSRYLTRLLKMRKKKTVFTVTVIFRTIVPQGCVTSWNSVWITNWNMILLKIRNCHSDNWLICVFQAIAGMVLGSNWLWGFQQIRLRPMPKRCTCPNSFQTIWHKPASNEMKWPFHLQNQGQQFMKLQQWNQVLALLPRLLLWTCF